MVGRVESTDVAPNAGIPFASWLCVLGAEDYFTESPGIMYNHPAVQRYCKASDIWMKGLLYGSF